MRIIQFEWKKLFRLKVFMTFILITILFITGLFIRNYLYQDIVKARTIDHFQDQASRVSSQLFIDQMKQIDIGEGKESTLDEAIETGVALHGKLQELLSSIKEDEHLLALQVENEAYELAFYYQSLNRYYPLSGVEMEDEIRLNQELLKHGLPKEDLTASVQPAVFMKQTVQLLLNTFGILILLVIVGTPILKEFDDNTIKLSYALPISSTKMVLSKWTSLVIGGAVWLLVVFLFSYTISTLFGKEQASTYEYPFFTKQMSFISAAEYIQQSIVIIFIYLLLLMSVFMLLSFFVKSTLIVHSMIVILLIGNSLIIRTNMTYSLLPWNYQELDFTLLQYEGISWQVIIFSFILAACLLLLTIKASKRREYKL